MTQRTILAAILALGIVSCSIIEADPLEQGQQAFAAQDYPGARDFAQAVLTDEPRNGPALVLLARAQLAMGQGADVLVTLARMIEADALLADASLIEAEARLQIGEIATARALLEGEDSAESWRLRALAAALEGDETGALSAFARGRQAEGDKRRLYTAEASFHLARGNVIGARDAVAQAQLLAPQSIETLFVSARLAQLSGEAELAARAYLAILEIAPLDRPALLGAITELSKAGRADLLRPLVQRGRQAYPDDIEFLYLTASVKADDGDWAGVRLVLQERETAITGHADARGLYGRALLELGQVELARAQIAPLYRRFPDNPGLARTYARILLETSEASEARRVIAPLASRPDAAEIDRAIAERAARE